MVKYTFGEDAIAKQTSIVAETSQNPHFNSVHDFAVVVTPSLIEWLGRGAIGFEVWAQAPEGTLRPFVRAPAAAAAETSVQDGASAEPDVQVLPSAATADDLAESKEVEGKLESIEPQVQANSEPEEQVSPTQHTLYLIMDVFNYVCVYVWMLMISCLSIHIFVR
jgi:hypothetical protein